MTMRFLADMGVSMRVVDWLRAQGYDTIHLRDEGPMQRLMRLATYDLVVKHTYSPFKGGIRCGMPS